MIYYIAFSIENNVMFLGRFNTDIKLQILCICLFVFKEKLRFIIFVFCHGSSLFFKTDGIRFDQCRIRNNFGVMALDI